MLIEKLQISCFICDYLKPCCSVLASAPFSTLCPVVMVSSEILRLYESEDLIFPCKQALNIDCYSGASQCLPGQERAGEFRAVSAHTPSKDIPPLIFLQPLLPSFTGNTVKKSCINFQQSPLFEKVSRKRSDAS